MEVFDKVKAIIADTLGCDEAEITEQASLKEDLGADSLDAVDLIMAIEDEFGISIESEKAETLVTVGDIIALIGELS